VVTMMTMRAVVMMMTMAGVAPLPLGPRMMMLMMMVGVPLPRGPWRAAPPGCHPWVRRLWRSTAVAPPPLPLMPPRRPWPPLGLLPVPVGSATVHVRFVMLVFALIREN
jgi:hypothetical protein